MLILFVTAVVYTKIKQASCYAVPLVVIVAIICPLLGCVAAFGLNTWMGNKMYTMMCVIPFLVLGIGE